LREIHLYVTDVSSYAYCKARPFLNRWLEAKPPLLRRIRILLGKIWHFLMQFGAEGVCEDPVILTFEYPEAKVIVHGRVDNYYSNDDGSVTVVEYKSGRMRRNKTAWPSDMVQVGGYALALESRGLKVSDCLIHYRNGVVQVDPNVCMELFRKHLDEMVRYILCNALPDVKPSGGKCRRCQYREVCLRLYVE